AARDALRKHNVAVASAVESKTAGNRSLLVGVAETSFDLAALAAALAGSGMALERLPQIGLTGVIDKMCDAVVKGGRLGMLFTGQPAAAVCLANRRHGVRAALGTCARNVADDRAAIGTNLLVVDPRGKSSFELGQMARELARGT